MRKLCRKPNPSFGDYLSLKTYGADEFSKKDFQELKKYAEGHGGSGLQEMLGDEADGRDWCSCVRWMMCGLSREDAARKVRADIEVRKNCWER